MSAWRGIIGKSFTPDEFEKYVASLKFGLWRPRFIVVHNTSAPDLKTWNGWQARKPPVPDEKWAQNLVGYYRDQQHWSAGPHLFITPRGILAFSPLTGPGTHSPAWNSITWGVETVGEFEHEPFAGAVRDNLIAALAILHAAAGLQPEPYELGVRGLHFHKEDPITTHKSCPGKNMVKAELVAAVEAEILRRHGGGGHAAHATLLADVDAADDMAADHADDAAVVPIAAPAPASNVQGDPVLFSVQRRLKAMNYNPGVVTGIWGGMTAGAISGFLNDRQSPIPAPTSLDMFDGVTAGIVAELRRAEADAFVRPVTTARASADPGTVAAVAPEVVPAQRNFVKAAWASLLAFLSAIWTSAGDKIQQAWDFFTDHKNDFGDSSSLMSTASGYLGEVPTSLWILLGAAGLAWIAIDARDSVKKITASVQTGARQ